MGKLNEVVGRINMMGATNPNKVDDLHSLNESYKEISNKVERFQRDNKSRFDEFKRSLLDDIKNLNKDIDRRSNTTS